MNNQYTKEQPVARPITYYQALSLTPGWAVEGKGRSGSWKVAIVLTQDMQRKWREKRTT